MVARVARRTLAALAALGATSACAPHARPMDTPYRASVAAFYMGPPRSDAAAGTRADVSLERWVDDRVLVGVDVESAFFSRTKDRTESLVGAGVRVTYVLDLAEWQPRFGARGAMERWTHGDGTASSLPLVVVPFAALDWAPRAWPLVLGAETLAPPVLTVGSSPAVPAAAFGLRGAYVF